MCPPPASRRTAEVQKPDSLTAPRDIDHARSSGFPSRILDNFRGEMARIADSLGDVEKRLFRMPGSERLWVEADYTDSWKDVKHTLGREPENVELAKGILRAQGCHEPFLEAVEKIIKAGRPYDTRLQEDRLTRFNVALRYAVHLSPDGGEQVYQHVDALTDTRRTQCPLSFVAAYEAFKVRHHEK